jgi:hypothetical protein
MIEIDFKFQISNFKFRLITEELFYALTAALLVFGILEFIKPRLVLAYFNLNYLLLAWLIFGIILLKTSDKDREAKERKNNPDVARNLGNFEKSRNRERSFKLVVPSD